MYTIEDVDDPTMFFDTPDPGWHNYEEIQRNTARAREDSAWIFHRNNPGILLELRRLAHQLKDAGHRKYSIKGLFEVLRFNAAIRTTGKKYKLNNNLTPFYARLLMDTDPELRGFFNTRESKRGQS